MRVPAIALAALVLAGPAYAIPERVAFVHAGNLIVLDLSTRRTHVVLRHAGRGPVHWSATGRLVSSGGRVAGGPTFPTGEVKWAAKGDTLGYTTENGGVVVWSPSTGRRTIVPDGWGATSMTWGPGGEIALGRSVCHVPCGVPREQGVWIWDRHTLRRVVGPLRGVQRPEVVGWTADGRVLWWSDPQGSGSIAADGLTLYANGERVAATLVFPDYVVRCGRHLVLSAGGDRYATRGKWIFFDGRNISRDPSRSWVSPSCSSDGTTLVAAAGRNWEEPHIGAGEHRAIWQLLPKRRQLTHPPAGSTDENPRLLRDGSVLFVRTRTSSRSANNTWYVTEHARLEQLRNGTLKTIADVTYTTNELSPLGYFANYYGHYGWPWLIAATP